MQKKKNIAFLVGGYSGEFEISLRSADYVEKQLVSEKYEFYKIVISSSAWYYLDFSGRRIMVDKDDFSILVNGDKIVFDAAFILIHGTPGEDGMIQGYLDLVGVPYPSCDRLCSTITFDKKVSNTIVGANGFSVASSILLKKNERLTLDELLSRVSLPVFVKPNHGGSSLGTFKVVAENDLLSSIEKSFLVGDDVLVEEYIPGRELTIGVVKWKGEILTFPITEIIAPNDFFDFEAKYTVGGCDEITPADILPRMKSDIEESAKSIYELFNCKGVVRVDYIWHDQKNVPFFLEVNTIPGVTKTSFIPQQLEEMNWSVKKLFIGLLDEKFDAAIK